jgi:hypothetical protein
MAVVTYAPEIFTRLRDWGEAAARHGLHLQLAAALREMDEQLRSDPESWGDPQWDLRSLRLTCYQRCGPVLLVRYAVHIDGSPVFVREVRLTPGSQLFETIE